MHANACTVADLGMHRGGTMPRVETDHLGCDLLPWSVGPGRVLDCWCRDQQQQGIVHFYVALLLAFGH